MKVVHLCLCGPMTDGFSYQENVITKYHKRMGNDVTVITSEWQWGKDGKTEKSDKKEYVNEDGVKIIRIPVKKGNVTNRFKIYPDLYKILEAEAPEVLFIHGTQFLDTAKVIRYLKRRRDVTAYADNHVDYSNGAHGWVSRNLLHRGLWRACTRCLEPYVKKFYGVLPARVDFLTDMYGLPTEKCELLVMGADDDLVSEVTAPDRVRAVREKYGIGDGDFLLVTGGKINHNRPETLDLMKAAADCGERVKLIVFGSVSNELRDGFEELLIPGRIEYVGWQDARGTYELMAAADTVAFTGLHSVMWEQAAALGTPCIFRDIVGFRHVDLGGNAVMLDDVSADSLKKVIEEISESPEKLASMKRTAVERGMKAFSYREIAKRSIE